MPGANAERKVAAPESRSAPLSPDAAPSCATRVVRPLFGGKGWHRVQYDLEDAYCGEKPGRMFEAVLAPGARLVTENHYAGGLFTALLARGDATAARRWLRAQLDEGLQGDEQGGGYTNYYRADVLAGLRWAAAHDDAELARLATDWLRRSFALDALHTVPGSFEVTLPCSRVKLYNRDGRVQALALLAGVDDPRAVLAARRWRYPAYDDVRWLADAILAGRLSVEPELAAWALRRDRDALRSILATLEPVRLRSPLVWVLLSSGGWYSYAPDGIANAPSRPVDAVVVRADGTREELVRPKGIARGAVRIVGKRLVDRGDESIEPGGGVTIPSGEVVTRVEIGRSPHGQASSP